MATDQERQQLINQIPTEQGRAAPAAKRLGSMSTSEVGRNQRAAIGERTAAQRLAIDGRRLNLEETTQGFQNRQAQRVEQAHHCSILQRAQGLHRCRAGLCPPGTEPWALSGRFCDCAGHRGGPGRQDGVGCLWGQQRSVAPDGQGDSGGRRPGVRLPQGRKTRARPQDQGRRGFRQHLGRGEGLCRQHGRCTAGHDAECRGLGGADLGRGGADGWRQCGGPTGRARCPVGDWCGAGGRGGQGWHL